MLSSNNSVILILDTVFQENYPYETLKGNIAFHYYISVHKVVHSAFMKE